MVYCMDLLRGQSNAGEGITYRLTNLQQQIEVDMNKIYASTNTKYPNRHDVFLFSNVIIEVVYFLEDKNLEMNNRE